MKHIIPSAYKRAFFDRINGFNEMPFGSPICMRCIDLIIATNNFIELMPDIDKSSVQGIWIACSKQCDCIINS